MTEREKICEQLSAYLDGELTAAEAQRVQQAVAENASLAGELTGLRYTRELLRRLPRAHAPGDFVERVLARTERLHLVQAGEGRSSDRWTVWFRHLATAAVLLIAAGVGIVVGIAVRQSQQAMQAPGYPEVSARPETGGEAPGRRSELAHATPADRKATELDKSGGSSDEVGKMYAKVDPYSKVKDEYKRIILDEAEQNRSDAKAIVLNVTNLEEGRKAVENVLRNGRIEPLYMIDTTQPEKTLAKSDIISLNGGYVTNTIGGNQVEILAVVNPDEVPKLQVNLDNDAQVQRNNADWGLRRDGGSAAGEPSPRPRPAKPSAEESGDPNKDHGFTNSGFQVTTVSLKGVTGGAGVRTKDGATPWDVRKEGQDLETPYKSAGGQQTAGPAPTRPATGQGKIADGPGQLQVTQTGWSHEALLNEIIELFQSPKGQAEVTQQVQAKPAEPPAVAFSSQGAVQTRWQGGEFQAVKITLNLKLDQNYGNTVNMALETATSAPASFPAALKVTAPSVDVEIKK
jgi:negative regulator of sigma E activity